MSGNPQLDYRSGVFEDLHSLKIVLTVETCAIHLTTQFEQLNTWTNLKYVRIDDIQTLHQDSKWLIRVEKNK